MPITFRQQRGVVLLVALVFLLILTIAGVSALRLSTVEERLTGNYSDRNVAFQSAESALREAEEFIRGANFQLDNFYASCTQAQCFDANCTNGLCFTGTYDAGTECDVSVPASPANEVFQDPTVWNTAGRHRASGLDFDGAAGPIAPARYIVEFYCFAVKNSDIDFDEQYSPANRYSPNYWEPLYRITALGTGRQPTTRVMLQVNFRRN